MNFRFECNASRILVVSNVVILPSYFSLGRLADGIMAEVFLIKKCLMSGFLVCHFSIYSIIMSEYNIHFVVYLIADG